MQELKQFVFDWGPAFIVVSFSIILLLILQYFFFASKGYHAHKYQLPKQLIMLALILMSIVMVIVILPINDNLRGQFLSLLGILLTATIALASTTFVSNAMAGLMLRVVENFRPGDFIKVGEHFGRVSERKLLYTEIQTENRDLATLPNLYLATNPVTVVSSSGTVISATISLGYDVYHETLIDLLKTAAERAELQDGFVHILELNDYSVSYRVAGFLADARNMLSARSRLRACILTTLHERDIEIVSPSFMNQRVLDKQNKIIPKMPISEKSLNVEKGANPEKMLFDKADAAAFKELLVERVKTLTETKKQLQESLKAKEQTEEQKAEIEQQIEKVDNRITKMKQRIDKFNES